MSGADFLTPSLLIADITVQTQDENFSHGFSRSWYTSQIERALAELSFTTYYAKRTCDIKIDTVNLKIEIPEGLFNIRETYLISPDCDGNFTNSANLFNKRLFNNKGKGASYTAKVRADGNDNPNFDPFYSDYIPNGYDTVYYYAINGRTMMLSSNVTAFTHVRIVANDAGTIKLTDAPIIPRMLREAVVAYVCEKYFSAMKARDRAYRVDWSDWFAVKEKEMNKGEGWIKRMDTAQKENLQEYMSLINA